MRHASIPIFVPHAACPNDCVFCNQKKISGTENPIKDVSGYIRASLEKMNSHFDHVDIAFFGGSFTGIARHVMEEYLKSAKYFLDNSGVVTGIRLSTRPDYIDDDVLAVLKKYSVTTIELGVQSLCDEVLLASKRGHIALQTMDAVKKIKEYGFELILQLMPGLPKDTKAHIYDTANQVVDLKPDGVRLYPCVVIKDTELEQMYLQGAFSPLSVKDAVDICADLTNLFNANGIKIIRTGLHSSDLVKNNGVVAGPFHSAFGEMVMQKIYLDKAKEQLEKLDLEKNQEIVIAVPLGCVSKMMGQKGENIRALKNLCKCNFRIIENKSLSKTDSEITVQAAHSVRK